MCKRTCSLLVGLLFIAIILGTFSGVTSIAEEKPVKIGYGLPFTGHVGWLGKTLDTVKMAVEEIEAAGGVVGRPIKLVVAGTEATTSGATSGMQKLVSAGVIGIIGGTSHTYRAVVPIIEDAGVVMISPCAGTTALSDMGGTLIFRTVSSDIVLGSGMVKKAKELDAETAVLFFNTTEGAASVRAVIRKACQSVGIEIVGEAEWSPGQASYQSELLQALGNNPDVVFFEVGPKDGGVIFKQWRTLGVASDATWIGTDHTNDELLKASWPDSKGAFGVLAGPKINDRFKNWEKQLEEFRGEQGIPTFSTNAWDATNIMALAIEAAGEATREGIKNNIRDVANPPGVKVTTFAEGKKALGEGKDINYIGFAGAQDFNEYGDVITTLQVVEFDNADERTRISTLTKGQLESIYSAVLEKRAAED